MRQTTKVYKIGQIVPSSNVTMEREIPAILARRMAVLPERFSFHSSRVRMHKVVREELERMNSDMTRCALELSDAQVDVLSTACLVATMCMGKGYHRTTTEEIVRATENAKLPPKVMTSAGALIDELKSFGAKKISLMAPYSDALTRQVIEYIEHEGIIVQDSLNFRIEDNIAVGERDPLQLLEDVKRLNVKGVDAVVLSACVQMPSLAAIQLAQQALGIPVTSTAICTVRRMLRLLELSPVAPDAGAFLGDMSGL